MRAAVTHRRLRLVKDIGLTVCFLGLMALIVARLDGEGEVLTGPFRVVDGDTLALGADRLRLIGIDAPELQQTCQYDDGRSWSCGEQARGHLSQLLAQGAPECRGSQTDRYHRLLVSCLVGGQSINARMVREGFALADGAVTFRGEQSQAQAARLGLWAGRFEHPRVWRDRMGLINDDKEKEGIWHDIKNFLTLHWL